MESGFKILLVEDDASFGMAVKSVLSAQNEIVHAPSLIEARKVLETRQFDIVLLDKGLPDGDALVLIPELKSKFPQTAILILTGDADFTAANRCINAGADDYVVKSDHVIPDLLVRIPAAIREANATIRRESLKLKLPNTVNDLSRTSFDTFMKTAERAYFARALELCNRSPSEVADRIGLSRATIFNKMNELDIPKRSTLKRQLEMQEHLEVEV